MIPNLLSLVEPLVQLGSNDQTRNRILYGSVPKLRPLDRIDRQILALLQNDARLANKELARRVGLAPSTCLGRVQRLVQEGTLRGFHAAVDPERLGLPLQAMVFVQLEHHGGAATETFRDRILARPEVIQLYHVGGAQDLLIHVAARDTDHLREVVMDEIAAGPQVRHIETNLIFEHHVGPYPTDEA
jgi:DNA-binding Lrp family transcriptional regulator